MIYPSDGMRRMSPAGMVTTGADNQTLTAALDRAPNAADTLMLGPLVQSVSTQTASTQTGSTQTGTSGGGR